MVRRTALGIVGAFAGAVIGASAWAAITDVSGFQIGYMSVGVGFLAGYGMHVLGGVPTVLGARVAAAIGLLGCVLGNLMVAGIEIVKHDTSASPASLAAAMLTRPQIDASMLHDAFSIMDVLFYAIAIYTAYRTALRGGPRRAAIAPAASPATASAAASAPTSAIAHVESPPSINE